MKRIRERKTFKRFSIGNDLTDSPGSSRGVNENSSFRTDAHFPSSHLIKAFLKFAGRYHLTVPSLVVSIWASGGASPKRKPLMLSKRKFCASTSERSRP